MSIIVSKQRLVEIQQSIVGLADEVREGCWVDIRRLENAVVNVCQSYVKLKPSKYINETDKCILNVEKLTLLQQSIIRLSDEFVEGKYVDVREAERRVLNVCNCWINIGKV